MPSSYSVIRSVAVYCGSSTPLDPAFDRAAEDLGKYLADHEIRLIFGGSDVGTMKVLASSVQAHGGKVTGVFTKNLPGDMLRKNLDETVITENLADRKAEMLFRADAVIALPGSFGTWDELFDALGLRKIPAGGISAPVGVLNVNGFFDPVFALIENSVRAGYTKAEHAKLLVSGSTPEELFRRFEEQRAD